MKHFLVLLSLIIFSLNGHAQNSEKLYKKYDAAMRKGDYKKVEKELRKISEQETDKFFGYLRMGSFFGKTDQLDSAATYFVAALNYHAVAPIDRSHPGFTQRRNYYYLEAVEVFTKLIEQDPIADNYACRGMFLAELNHLEKAKDDFEKSTVLDPTHAPSFYNLGLTYRRLGNPKKAIENYDRCTDLAPDHPGASLNKGFAYITLEQYDEAINEFNFTLENQIDIKERSYTTNNIGYCYYKLGDYEEAARWMKESERLNPLNSYLYRNLALLAIATDDTKKICRHINKSLELGFSQQYGNEVEELKNQHCTP